MTSGNADNPETCGYGTKDESKNKKNTVADENSEKNCCLSQNQSLMETSAQMGGILMAVLALMLALYSTDRVLLQHLVSQIILFLVSFSAIAFFSATTYYLRGSNPIRGKEKIKKLNIKGDVFFALGLLGLLIVPTLLFRVLDLYIAMVFCAIVTGIVWFHLFFNEDHVGIVAIRLPLYGIVNLDSEKVHEKAGDTEMNKGNVIIILLFYMMIGVFITEGLSNHFFEFSPIGALLEFIHVI